MTEAELVARTKRLSDELDDEGISNGDQAAICGAVLTAALLMLPHDEAVDRIKAHAEALAACRRDLWDKWFDKAREYQQ